MQSEHLQFAQQSYESFVAAAIQRIAFSGENVYRYTIRAGSIKSVAGLQRLKSSIINEYVSYFVMMGVSAHYNEAFETIDLTLNLNTCSLSPQQADDLATAMVVFRQEHL
jgi:hypothetical protein